MRVGPEVRLPVRLLMYDSGARNSETNICQRRRKRVLDGDVGHFQIRLYHRTLPLACYAPIAKTPHLPST